MLPRLTGRCWRGCVSSDAATLLIARSDGKISGTLTLVMFPIPTGVRAWIEDVIVDEAARGQGIGQVLTIEALRIAEKAGARTVDLTSRPSREAAGRLYERLRLRQSRDHPALYRYPLSSRPILSPAGAAPGESGRPPAGGRQLPPAAVEQAVHVGAVVVVHQARPDRAARVADAERRRSAPRRSCARSRR